MQGSQSHRVGNVGRSGSKHGEIGLMDLNIYIYTIYINDTWQVHEGTEYGFKSDLNDGK